MLLVGAACSEYNRPRDQSLGGEDQVQSNVAKAWSAAASTSAVRGPPASSQSPMLGERHSDLRHTWAARRHGLMYHRYRRSASHHTRLSRLHRRRGSRNYHARVARHHRRRSHRHLKLYHHYRRLSGSRRRRARPRLKSTPPPPPPRKVKQIRCTGRTKVEPNKSQTKAARKRKAPTSPFPGGNARPYKQQGASKKPTPQWYRTRLSSAAAMIGCYPDNRNAPDIGVMPRKLSLWVARSPRGSQLAAPTDRRLIRPCMEACGRLGYKYAGMRYIPYFSYRGRANRFREASCWCGSKVPCTCDFLNPNALVL